MPSPRHDCECPRARHVHGTLGAYQIDGCRCFECAYVRSEVRYSYLRGERWLEAGWLPVVGVARRLQALTVIGYTDRTLALHLDINPSYVVRLRNGGGERVTPATWDKVSRVYEELWDKPYLGPYAIRTKRLAAAKGWLPPMAWDDEDIDKIETQSSEAFVHNQINPSRDQSAAREIGEIKPEKNADIDEIAVELAMYGRRVPLTKAEMTEAVARLTARGMSAEMIGGRLGITDRTVVRKRALAA